MSGSARRRSPRKEVGRFGERDGCMGDANHCVGFLTRLHCSLSSYTRRGGRGNRRCASTFSKARRRGTHRPDLEVGWVVLLVLFPSFGTCSLCLTF